MNDKPLNLIMTGTTSDIGESIISTFTNHAATKIVSLGHNKERLERLKKRFHMTYHLLDMNKPKEIENKLRNSLSEQHFDILVNCAGSWHNSNKAYYGLGFEEIPTTELFEVMNVNLISHMLITKFVLKSMKIQGYGSIINIIGTFSGQGSKWIHYFTAKKALEQMTYGLAAELKGTNIRINAISPRDTKTRSLKKFFPDEYASAVDPSTVAKLVYDISLNEHIKGQCIEVR